MAGRAGLATAALSAALTFTVAVLGPSVMEPVLPGLPGQPPWSSAAHPAAVLAVSLAAAALAAGAAGLGLSLRALHRGWTTSPAAVQCAGLIAAAAITLVPPFGSSDQLSYAAYGRLVVTGHDPYAMTPAMLARLGDPVARAVQDWRASPSVYGGLATGGQALASLAGGTSARLTVFVLSLLNLAAFAVTGLMLHRLCRGSRPRQLRAALLWTFNPLLLQVLVAGEHVDSQAIVFAVAAVAVFAVAARSLAGHGASSARPAGVFLTAAGAGALAGLGAAVKLTMALVLAGLIVAAAAGCWPHGRRVALLAGGLIAGFAVTSGASVAAWGAGSLRPALRAGSLVSIGSPWRPVRSALQHLAGTGEGGANDIVKAGAIVLAVLLLVLLLRPAWPPEASGGRPDLVILAAGCAFAFAFAWLLAWPYVLPWYDGLAWALLALLRWPWPWPWPALDWLLLARTTALAAGYLPARVADAALPPSLGWLQSVVRTGVTPAVLLTVTVLLAIALWRRPAGAALVSSRTDPDYPPR